MVFFRYDFFVVSQSVNQGSVSPTSYNVISDNTGLNPDKMQRLAVDTSEPRARRGGDDADDDSGVFDTDLTALPAGGQPRA